MIILKKSYLVYNRLFKTINLYDQLKVLNKSLKRNLKNNLPYRKVRHKYKKIDTCYIKTLYIFKIVN